MKRAILKLIEAILCLMFAFLLSGCGAQAKGDGDTGPRPDSVEPDLSSDNFSVDHPERFPLTTVGEYKAAPQLDVTGVVSADSTRQVPVPSLTSGRVLEIDAKVGDQVRKGQVLFKVQSSDVAGAVSDYHKAIKNEQSAIENLQLAEKNENLTTIQRTRSQLLFDKGATPKSDLEIKLNAEDAAKTSVANARVALENARVDVATTTERLHLLRVDPEHSTGVVDVVSPISGVITDQQITAGAGVQASSPPISRSPTCRTSGSSATSMRTTYRQSMSVNSPIFVQMRIPIAFSRHDQQLAMMDPTLRTAKVRLEVENPGIVRIGMFVTATFHGQAQQQTLPCTGNRDSASP